MLRWPGDHLALDGEGNRFHAAGYMELGEDAADVEFDGRAANNQLRGNIGVAHSLNHQSQYIPLSHREIVAWRTGMGYRMHQRLSYLRRYHRPASVNRSDGVGQLIGGNILEQVTDRASLEHRL